MNSTSIYKRKYIYFPRKVVHDIPSRFYDVDRKGISHLFD